MSYAPPSYPPPPSLDAGYSGYSESSVAPHQEQRPTSPTPSELEDADESPFGFTNLFNRGKRAGPPNVWVIVGGVVFLVFFVVVMILHNKIVDAINPVAEKLRNLPGGWAIPIGILVILSFPPLFGHELVDIMIGVVWGVWKGFLIAAAGHLLGEIANWFVFKYWCTGRSQKYEQQKLGYACLAQVVREGGFFAVIVIRFSAIPGHLSTVIFAVCGVSFWTYLVANILTLPKLFVTVYVGVAADSNSESKTSKIISYVVTASGIIITIIACRWTFRKMDAVRPEIVEERRAARAARRGIVAGQTSRYKGLRGTDIDGDSAPLLEPSASRPE
ncbi:hypothetical protein DL93DRAFT_2165936 [Clavulina sp. PMI_390]|nr:hypothetical protein DL93DRAFT_2165936 [Clavulina sp. PMI_390]